MNGIEQKLEKPGEISTSGLPARVKSRYSLAKAKQDGTIAVMVAPALLAMLGFCGLALELSQLYNRKVEMQNVADGIALAAARKLDGTAAGVSNALTAAAQAAALFSSGYGKNPISWSDAAISFSDKPDRNGAWVGAGAANGMPQRMFYVKVDTNQLGNNPGNVPLILMPALYSSSSTFDVNGTAVAGRSIVDVAPLAICAMSTLATDQLVLGGYNELLEYGFRRGVSYDLMRLNPVPQAPSPPPANFVVNPLALPGTSGSATDTGASTVGPYACAGALASPRVLGGEVLVTSPFPLGSLYQQLNSRFDQYTGNLCDFNGAPPDKNIKQFVSTGITWVTKTPLAGQGSAESTVGSKLQTIALDGVGGTAQQYGPLWVYAKAAKYANPEPVGGYALLPLGAWSPLYGTQTANAAYPIGSLTPYKATSGINYAAPDLTHRPVADRRVLNVPLLSCPVSTGTNVSAQVVAIGRFFMTVPATSTQLYAEFAGAMKLEKVSGEAELY